MSHAWAPQQPPPVLRPPARRRRVRRCCLAAAVPHDAVVLALDVGTTGVKAACVARDGRLVATATASYARATRSVAPGCAEQAPADWLAAAGDAATRCVADTPLVRAGSLRGSVCTATHALSRAQSAAVAAVALCGQMQTVTLVGRAPRSLARRRALLYSDTRARDEAAAVDAALAAAPGLASSNLRAAGGASVPAKLLWLLRHEPATLRASSAALLGAHSLIAWALTGAAAADATSASASGVLAPGGAAYAAAALEHLGVDADLLPQLLRPDAPVGHVTACAGRLSYECVEADDDVAFAFPACLAGVPVFHGAGDVAATAAGAGGGTHLYLGTSGWAANEVADDGKAPPPGVFQLAAPAPGRVIRAAAATTTGGAIEWARAAFFGASSGCVVGMPPKPPASPPPPLPPQRSPPPPNELACSAMVGFVVSC